MKIFEIVAIKLQHLKIFKTVAAAILDFAGSHFRQRIYPLPALQYLQCLVAKFS